MAQCGAEQIFVTTNKKILPNLSTNERKMSKVYKYI